MKLDVELMDDINNVGKEYWVRIESEAIDVNYPDEVLLPMGRTAATAKSKAIRFLQKAIKQIEGME